MAQVISRFISLDQERMAVEVDEQIGVICWPAPSVGLQGKMELYRAQTWLILFPIVFQLMASSYWDKSLSFANK